MKKTLALCALFCLLFSANTLAYERTAVLDVPVKNGSVPSVDGLSNAGLQANINSILKAKAESLAKEAGGSAQVSYDITMNQPTLFSVVIKAAGNKTIYAGVNIDNTSGKEADTSDFFYQKDDFAKLIGTKPYVFTEDGLLLAETAGGPFTKKVPYSALMKNINIANSARFITTYKLTAEAQDKTLRLNKGEIVSLYLHSNPTTGYDWYIIDGAKQPGLVNLGHSFVMPSNPRGMTGSPGTSILLFSFTQPGTYKLRIDYKRNWMPDYNMTNTYNFLVK